MCQDEPTEHREAQEVPEVDSAARGQQIRRWHWWSLCGMVAIILLFLLPALTASVPMYHDDNVVYAIPQLMAMARSVQTGRIGLWDSNTFAGGLPHYANDETPIYYLPVVPFLLLADLDDLVQSSYVIFILPYVLHIIWASVGAYLFGRLVLRLHPTGCAMVGLLYGLKLRRYVRAYPRRK